MTCFKSSSVPAKKRRASPKKNKWVVKVTKQNTYLVDANDLTVNLLDLLQLAHEVPEAGLGNNLVDGKEAHAEKLGGSILLGGEMATDQLVLVKLL